GSVPVGKQLASLAGAHMKRMTMELGGHAPVIVFDDAEVDKAARYMAKFKAYNAGQLCISPTRFYVQEGAYARFLEAFHEAYGGLRVGDGLDPDTQMGPLAHRRRVASMKALVKDAVQRGARVVAGGD